MATDPPAERGEWRVERAVRAASVETAHVVIVRVVHAASAPGRNDSRRNHDRHSRTHDLPERTDRTLGAYAGSAVGCIRGVGAVGLATRATGGHGCFASP